MNMIEVDEKTVEEIFEKEISNHQKMVNEKLESYSSVDFFFKLHRLIRTIEEFINIFTFGLEIDDTLENFMLKKLSITDSFLLEFYSNSIWQRVSDIYGKDTKIRLMNLVKQSININNSFKMFGWDNFEEESNLDSIYQMINYFQSRRRYFVSFLYSIDTTKRGTHIPETELILELIPLIECHCMPLTSIQQKKVFHKLNNNFKLFTDGVMCTSNCHYNILDSSYLEPERISLPEHLEHRETTYNDDTYYVDSSKIFSINEVKNSIIKMEVFFRFYVTDISEFIILKDLIFELLEYTQDEYFILLEKEIFENIIKRNSNNYTSKILNKLISYSHKYIKNINLYKPIIQTEDGYVTSINLLMRFMYFYKNEILNKKRRFQIHSGFVFEDEVRKKLEENSFFIPEGTKRIERKEFDIVAIKNNTIYNFQCKNSFIDISMIYSSQENFIKKSRRLKNYFNRALKKEVAREHLLKKKLGIEKVNHYVLSRYPVINENEKIISFFDLDNWINKNFKD